MKANKLSCKDLMVDDWVRLKITITQHNTKVTNIDANSIYTEAAFPIRYDEIEPIFLTPEILEKNGWEKRPTGYVFYTDGKRYDNSLWYIFGSNTFVVNTAEFQIKYVHELQHALRLCGIKKTIEL